MISPQKSIEKALSEDWTKNFGAFLGDVELVDRIYNSTYRLALWSKQLEQVDKNNPAICFIRSMQQCAHQATAAIALSMYKASAALIRALFENALYYSYFRNHPVELNSLVLNDKYYLSKEDLLKYHEDHVIGFKLNQSFFGLIGEINTWYSQISAVIHNQVPGSWVANEKLGTPNRKICLASVQSFEKSISLVNNLFLCSLSGDFWQKFDSTVKNLIVKGLSAEIKKSLNLDKA